MPSTILVPKTFNAQQVSLATSASHVPFVAGACAGGPSLLCRAELLGCWSSSLPPRVQVVRDGDGVLGLVDYATADDMATAIKKLDDTEFRNPYDK